LLFKEKIVCVDFFTMSIEQVREYARGGPFAMVCSRIEPMSDSNNMSVALSVKEMGCSEADYLYNKGYDRRYAPDIIYLCGQRKLNQ